jgi:hypothetical protein
MKACAVIFMLAVATCAYPAGVTRPPHMTGDQFIAELRGGPSVQRLFDKPYALGYLAGVVDATQGRTWCVPLRLKPDEADDQVLDELAKRPIGSIPGIAAAVLLERYKVRFPSAGSACTFKPRLTGDEFTVWAIGNRRKSDAEKLHPSPEVSERERFTDGYVGGVVDATQGTDWCAPRRIKPGELDAIGYWSLVDRPAGSMPGKAATLLHEQFIANYPCRPQP